MSNDDDQQPYLSAPGLILCAGMPRSGSTLSFNVATNLVLRSDGKAVVKGMYSDDIAHALNVLGPADYSVVKCHLITDDTGWRLVRKGVPIIYTYRKLEEAVASAMAFTNQSFQNSVDMSDTSLRFISSLVDTRNVPLFLEYDEMIRLPIDSVRSVADFLKIDADEDDIQRVVDETSLASAVERIKNIPTLEPSMLYKDDVYTYERESLLHWNHISGKGALWQDMLSAEQVGQIAVVAERWRDKLGLRL